MVTEEHLAEGRLYPPLSTIREVSFKIAVKVGDLSMRSFLPKKHATTVVCFKYCGVIISDYLHMKLKTKSYKLCVLVCVYIQ